ncbi:potassium uptake protein, TrkH family [Candidatus Magnetomorum sp. HK-1]|nr:potassium uptake protein, TrkH family [Candidatus Magnetomorum sp. HK-1]
MKIFKCITSPVIFPIIFFALVILMGSVLLYITEMKTAESISWTDLIFTATSAACVTGLTVVDTAAYFTKSGQIVILCLIQIGGFGIMTLTSLSIYFWRRRTSITDRIAVGQVLLHDTRFKLGKFLIEIVSWTLFIECIGAFLIYFLDPDSFSLFSAFFHSISAFCNAGFSLFSDNLTAWKNDWGMNLVFMALIFLGGIGFSVFVESKNYIKQFFKKCRTLPEYQLSWYSKMVIRTSVFLIILGWISIYVSEYVGYNRIMILDDALLTSLFQSVTCRTAGFNTINIGQMTNVSLVIILFLMFIGGASGSCAGGIKVTTFRVMVAAIVSELKGKKQTVIGKYAINETAVKKAMVLFVISIMIIFLATFLLDFTEGGDKPHHQVRGQFLEILFESVSAFCTVGLSTGLTPKLSTIGKWVIILLMFIGRLGPFVLIAALQSVHDVQHYRLPEENVMIG